MTLAPSLVNEIPPSCKRGERICRPSDENTFLILPVEDLSTLIPSSQLAVDSLVDPKNTEHFAEI